MRLTGITLAAWVPGLLSAACSTAMPTFETSQEKQALRLLLPKQIEIVEPFTRVKSFDHDNVPDGIELLLRAVNSLDNPGLMLAGDIRVELYEFVPASGDRKGRRLEHWRIELFDSKQQKTYWNSLTQMYEFRLGVNPERIPPARHYVLAVTYDSPFGDRLSDERVIRFLDSAARPASLATP